MRHDPNKATVFYPWIAKMEIEPRTNNIHVIATKEEIPTLSDWHIAELYHLFSFFDI